MSDLRLPDRFRPNPRSLIDRSGTPATISGWKAVADGFLTHECCAFHRNVEISSRYAWIYRLMPAFKWAGMAAIASHHVRLALFPLRLDTDRTGYVDIPRSLVRPGLLLMEDVNTIRATNNAIFDDIFWVHFAYVCADDGIECLRALLGPERHYAPILSGFEAIDQGRRVLAERSASAEDRQTAEDLIWAGNVQLLEARAARPGATELRSPLLRLRQAHLDRVGHDLRGAWHSARRRLLHFVLSVVAPTSGPARFVGLAEDHPLRRPLALGGDERRSTLSEIRCRHALDRRHPATHSR